MRLLKLAAVPHPEGNRIDVAWEMPASSPFPRVRVVRHARSHPLTPNPASPVEGIVVPELPGESFVVDRGLKGETVYYYSLYPYASANPDGTIVISDANQQIDRHNRAAAMATSPLGLTEQMYALLPLLYHRYDTVLPRNPPPAMSAADRQHGALRRFLDLPGAQLDQLFSFARAILDFHHLDRVDGMLLPLLAQWIGWNTDYSLEIEEQRNEIRHAPEVYRTIGIIPVVEATVKRISARESRTKEFVHNVATTNHPPRFNLWWRRRRGGAWDAPALLSLDAAFDGRLAAVRSNQGLISLFYHKEEGGRWSIWFKTFSNAGGWTPSEPLSTGRLVQKDPAAALRGARLFVFWGAYDSQNQRWQIEFRIRSGGTWSQQDVFVPPEGGAETQRRKPAVAADGDGIWLFWLELAGGRWVCKYNRHNGTTWQINPSPVLPLDGGQDPRVLDDLFVAFHPNDAGQRLWLFWARQDAPNPNTEPEQTRWRIVYRVKAGLDPTNNGDWSTIRSLPPAPDQEHDREPCPLVGADGSVELFWSSHRDGSWAAWRAVLDRTTHVWSSVEQLTTPPFAVRAPLAIAHGQDTLLIQRSNESLRYTSATYGATETFDHRYAGSTTLDTRNKTLLALRGKYEDIGAYVYDAGREGLRTNDDWYSRDTVGVFVPAEVDEQEISRLNRVLLEFLPLTDRAVLIKDA